MKPTQQLTEKQRYWYWQLECACISESLAVYAKQQKLNNGRSITMDNIRKYIDALLFPFFS